MQKSLLITSGIAVFFGLAVALIYSAQSYAQAAPNSDGKEPLPASIEHKPMTYSPVLPYNAPYVHHHQR